MASILVVDNERKMCNLLKVALESEGHTVSIAFTGEDGIRMASRESFDAVITDLKMPGKDGLDVMREIRRQKVPPEVMMMTAYASAQTAVEAMKLGAYDYLIKPFEMDEMKLKVRNMVERRQLQEENRDLKQALKGKFSLENIIGESGAMQKVFRMIQKVAASDATVLIRGESGTGKELVAQAIHNLSPRAEDPFIGVNSAALPETLLESELFGYEKGAFTGADQQKIGQFEAAGDGSIFLDEIGDMPATIQIKLLRVLQMREMTRLGSTKPISIKARMIAATNCDLEEGVKLGRFREDLYYRINVFPIFIPPLRARSEDVPLLVEFFLVRAGLSRDSIDPKAMTALQRYQWPGNVRELENVIERSLIMSDGQRITVDDLPSHVVMGTADKPAAFDIPEDGINLERLELDLIHRAIEKAGGNKSRAAGLLGITRRKLYSMMERLGGGEE